MPCWCGFIRRHRLARLQGSRAFIEYAFALMIFRFQTMYSIMGSKNNKGDVYEYQSQ